MRKQFFSDECHVYLKVCQINKIVGKEWLSK